MQAGGKEHGAAQDLVSAAVSLGRGDSEENGEAQDNRGESDPAVEQKSDGPGEENELEYQSGQQTDAVSKEQRKGDELGQQQQVRRQGSAIATKRV